MIPTPRDPLRWWEILFRYSLFEASDSAWSLIIVSTYFGTYLQTTFHQSSASFGWAVTLGALIVAVLSPILGTNADNTGRRQPYLRFFVFGVAFCTAAFTWTGSAASAVLLFIIAYVCAHAAFTFFAAMIPAVSNERNVETVISMSVGVGYAGGLICLLFLSRLVLNDQFVGSVFLPMALIYLALALPAMYLAPDFPARTVSKIDVGAAYRRMRESFRQARKHRYLFLFLVGDFLYENAVASVITLMGLYSRNIMGFQSNELTGLFGPAIVVAMLSAWFIFGPLTRVIGPKKTLLIDLAIWLLLLALIVMIQPGVALDLGMLHLDTKQLFRIAVAPLAGLGLAGVWSASRVLLTALTPVDESGEFWGLYNLSGRSASVLGDATWSLILTTFGEQLLGYRIAVVALAVYVLLGIALIIRLPDIRPSGGNFIKS